MIIDDTKSEHSYDSDKPLLPSTPNTTTSSDSPQLDEIPALYNPDATLEIPSSIAQGFLILLSGGTDTTITTTTTSKPLSTVANTAAETDNTTSTTDTTSLSNDNARYDDTNDEGIELAFAALTDGNVIDTCMGGGPQGGTKFSGSSFAVKSANAAKNVLRDAADSFSLPTAATTSTDDAAAAIDHSNEIQRMAVQTYANCFRIVIAYNDRLTSEREDLLSSVCCFNNASKNIRNEDNDALQNLKRCFVNINEALLIRSIAR